MFEKILIANRGEIACRIIRTLKRLGVESVAVYSDADAGALHVEQADEAYRIGPAAAAHSYLNIPAVIDAAQKAGAQAIHPGYGFLSENPDFAEACERNGLVFIGPSPKTLRLVGSKSDAKRLMEQKGIPVVPGYHGDEQEDAELARQAEAIGFPVLVKAAAGGGGKGMRLVERAADLAFALKAARREAAVGFGDDRLLLEKYIVSPRHIEVQIFGDARGNVVHLFERDCSLQRRYQKLLEEAPAPGLDDNLRAALAETAVAAARAAEYRGAGTVEFLVDPEGRFYFMEMNARLQVEHPVTEAITGLDLVEWQLLVAAGEPLPRSQREIRSSGHAVEARLYAEKPAQDFMPAAGILERLRLPEAAPFLRVECGVREGEAIGIHYDPLIAKLIALGDDRGRAIGRLRRALSRTRIAGIDSNRDFLLEVTGHGDYAKGGIDTGFIERHGGRLIHPGSRPAAAEILALAGLYLLLRRREEVEAEAELFGDPYSPWNDTSGWWLNLDSRVVFSFLWEGEIADVAIALRGGVMHVNAPGGEFDASARMDGDGALRAVLNGVRHTAEVVLIEGVLTVITPHGTWRLRQYDPLHAVEAAEAEEGRIVAPIPGRITELSVRRGDAVKKGARLLVLEAMKLEYDMAAPRDGRVTELHVSAGDLVAEGEVLLVVEDAASR